MILNSPYDNCKRFISTFVESQFPHYFRENGDELIQFVKAYYEFEEQTQMQFLNRSNNLECVDDVDTTTEEFLKYFKSKYANSLPFENSTTNRFIIKHIFDLYRSKGTERSLKLLMQMMYGNDNCEVYYPDKDVLRPSHSIWFKPRYIEVSHNKNNYSLLGKKVTGSTSKSTAFVESVVTKNLNGKLVDVIYLSNQRGEFDKNDFITDGLRNIFDYPQIIPSAYSIEFTDGGQNYSVGDLFDVTSTYGSGGIVKVETVKLGQPSITFKILDGGYGYTPTMDLNGNKILNSPTKIYVSDLALAIANSNLVDGDKLFDINGNEIGTVMGADTQTVWMYNTGGPGVWGSLQSVFDVNGNQLNVSRVYTGTGAQFEIVALTNVTNTLIYTDIIGASNINNVVYPLVPLSDLDYGFPKTVVPAEVISTRLLDAFGSANYDLGTVSELAFVSPGVDYDYAPMVKVVNELIVGVGYYDLIIDASNVTNLIVGDVITQSNGAKGIIKSINGDFATVRPISYGAYFQINTAITVQRTLNSFTTKSIYFDSESKPMGANLVIDTNSNLRSGEVSSISFINSGLGFTDGEEVILTSKKDGSIIKGMLKCQGSGVTEGEWMTTSSHLNWSTYIHDNDYYQEYSYEITSTHSLADYEDVVKKITHPAGTKLFGRVEKVEVFKEFYKFDGVISETNIIDDDVLEIF